MGLDTQLVDDNLDGYTDRTFVDTDRDGNLEPQGQGVIIRVGVDVLGGTKLWLKGQSGTYYYYAHLDSYASRVGQRVKAGELIAYNGQTGNARYTAPHVHFEVHPGGATVNPYPYVKAACG